MKVNVERNHRIMGENVIDKWTVDKAEVVDGCLILSKWPAMGSQKNVAIYNRDQWLNCKET